MKRTAKILISVFLCLVLIFGSVLPSLASEPKTAFVVVSGMNTFPLYKDGEKVFPTSTKAIMKMASKLILPLVGFFADGDYDKLGDALFPAALEAFDSLSCNPDGTSKYDVATTVFPANAGNYTELFKDEISDEIGVVNAGIEAYGAENTYFFNYDWRLDPLKHADELNTFIKNVKAETKCDRVALAAFSMGGTVTCSYLYKYGSADVDSVSLCSTAFQGTSCMDSLFTGDMDLDFYGLVRRIAQLTRNNFFEELIMLLNEGLEAYKINASLESIANGLTDNLKERIYKEMIIPVFGYMPGLWALVEGDSYEAAKSLMLSDADPSLVKAVDEYHYNVQDKAEEILRKTQKDTSIYIIAQYNMQGLPISKTASDSNNDFLIDAEFASGGAVCSKLGETLPDTYIQANNCGHDHISPDRQIDASTCMFPEQTWFIRDMAHVDYPFGEATDFLITLSSSKEQLTVQNSGYSQFMKYSSDNNTLRPISSDILQPTVMHNVFSFLSKLVALSAEIFFGIVNKCR